MEHVDLIAINKSDGELLGPARHMAADIRSAMSVARRRWKHWRPKVKQCSALEQTGISELWGTMQKFHKVRVGH